MSTAAVVNVLLDRKIEIDELVDQVLAELKGTEATLKGVARALAERKGTPAAKAQAFMRLVRAVVLAEAVRATPRAVALARRHLAAEVREVRRIGAHRLLEVPALRKPDVMRRLAERKEAGRGG